MHYKLLRAGVIGLNQLKATPVASCMSTRNDVNASGIFSFVFQNSQGILL